MGLFQEAEDGGDIPREGREVEIKTLELVLVRGRPPLSWVGVRGDTLLLREGAEGARFPPPDQYPATFTTAQLEGVSVSLFLEDKIKENQSLSEYLLKSDGT